MTITKEYLEKQFPGIRITGELNPDIPEGQWLFSAGLAQQIIDTANSKVAEPRDLTVCLIQQEDTNIFKVGITTDIKKRLRTLQQNNPNKLKLVTWAKTKNAEIIEQQVLRQLVQYSIRSEWVECEKSVVVRTFNRAVKRYQKEELES